MSRFSETVGLHFRDGARKPWPCCGQTLLDTHLVSLLRTLLLTDFKHASIQRLTRPSRAIRQPIRCGACGTSTLTQLKLWTSQAAVYARTCCAAAVNTSEQPWWNQEAALSSLLNLVNKTPTEVQVVTGPVSSGKSRMIKELVVRMKTSTPSRAIIYLDCRSGLDSAEIFARELQLQALPTWAARVPTLFNLLPPLIELMSAVVNLKINTASPVGMNFSFAVGRLSRELLPLKDVLSIYSEAIARARAVPGAPPPILIVVRCTVHVAKCLRHVGNASPRLHRMMRIAFDSGHPHRSFPTFWRSLRA